MKAGRELDALVVEKVMGQNFRPYAQVLTSYPSRSVPETPFYSTDIAAAWPIAEKFHILVQPLESGALAIIEDGVPDRDMQYIDIHRNDVSVWVVGETAPHAICLAALKATGTAQ